MDDKMKQLTVKLLRDWMASTKPDDIFIAEGPRGVTPRQYVERVENETPEGKAFLDYLEDAAKRSNQPLETFLKQAIRPNPPSPK